MAQVIMPAMDTTDTMYEGHAPLLCNFATIYTAQSTFFLITGSSIAPSSEPYSASFQPSRGLWEAQKD
jgi:hypothetical protein